MKQVINGMRYDTDKAISLASDAFGDGNNEYNCGRKTQLYKTKKGNYFVVHWTCWQGEHDNIEPVSKKEAMQYYEELHRTHVEWEEAFGESPEEA